MVETVIVHPELAGVEALMGEALIQLVQLQAFNPPNPQHNTPPLHTHTPHLHFFCTPSVLCVHLI